ncbi:MAG: UDP-N-acetylmuramoyl-L-alanyl-D-glutamate--2,6-diaminopimelate ligase [Clostridia bacterium]|nr:UDP-N-acetylmuramoyl-L-alanyl-D-glutamate--2,6-diaminopimelate ligase [Clostridia bacterium]
MKLMDIVAGMNDSVRLIGNGENVEITSLCMDSRKKMGKGAVFFCIPGFKFDGHNYAQQAVQAGVSALVVERELDVDCPQLLVSDAREAAAKIAAIFYGHPAKEMKLIGITGTKGKTTTSFLVKSILETAGYKVGLIGTVCSMIGDTQIPSKLTTPDHIDFHALLRQMADAGVEYVVMEVSAHAMELRRLVGIQFEAAAFTNLSQDHLDMFGTMDKYCAAKMRLFCSEMCKKAVYNADDERVRTEMNKIEIPGASYAIRVPSDIYAKNIEIGERGCSYQLTFYKRFTLEIDMKLSGVFNIYNAMTAAALCDAVGIGPDCIREGIEKVKNVPGRIEQLDTGTPYRVILDYAHSPDALENILETIRETAKGRVIALFGCGGDRDREKRPIMGEIGGRLANYCILTSDNPRSEDPFTILEQIEEGIKPTGGEYTVIENRREAIRYALTIAQPGDVVVLAGKGHETYQEIKGVKHPFDEKVVVQELLEEM